MMDNTIDLTSRFSSRLRKNNNDKATETTDKPHVINTLPKEGLKA